MQLSTRKINDSIKKMSQIIKQTFLKRKHSDGQSTYEKIINITHYQRNSEQNHTEVPSHAGQNGFYQKVYKQ